MSPARDQPEPTELIYVPNNSWAPILVAAGIGAAPRRRLQGLVHVPRRRLILLLGLRSWWRHSNDEISRMRREQQPDTAVIPAEPVRRPSALTQRRGTRGTRHFQATPRTLGLRCVRGR